jgi:pimeloyl-ACP methyl ester carboxylesterase
VLLAGPEDGEPVLLLHGNLSTGRFYEQLMAGAPDGLRLIAPDMRGFGDSEHKPIDATRGLADWADDAHAVLRALGIDRPPHLAGWSTGGAAIARYALDRPAASLTFIDPVSPYGYGATHPDGRPCAPDWAGTGGGTGSPDFAARIEAGDRTTEAPTSPLNVLRTSYWAPSFQVEPAREAMLLDEVLKSRTGDDGYPGDATPSEHWPGVAPGTRGILNALSGRHCSWDAIVELAPKPPVLWVHGAQDIVVADGSPWEMGSLGAAGHVPGWPGAEAFPPQAMVTQIRTVLERYRDAGGEVRMEWFEESGHFPVVDSAERFAAAFWEHVAGA